MKWLRYKLMLLRNAEHYRAICLRVGNDCLTTAPRVSDKAGYLYCHFVVLNRLKTLPVGDSEALEYVGNLGEASR